MSGNHPNDRLRMVPADGRTAHLRGRIVELSADGGKLHDGKGIIDFAIPGHHAGQVASGDIVGIAGRMDQGRLVAEEFELLQRPSSPSWQESGDWHRFRSDNEVLTQNLLVRNATTRALRAHFWELGFLEVETPTLLPAPGHEVHIDLFRLAEIDAGDRFLRGSPEHHMKRLLGAGFERIFQICRCFRHEASTPAHSPEFTMLEWYRAYATYDDVMNDLESLFTDLFRRLHASSTLTYQGVEFELGKPWERITVHEAFGRFADIDLGSCDDEEQFRLRARSSGILSVGPRDGWEEAFTKILVERIEPALVALGPVFLFDYPARLAALAKLKEPARTVAERVELYIGGLELANGYTELNDPVEQRQRFEESQRQRRCEGLTSHPLDDEFQKMMEEGMPPAAGVALGVDRLLMLLTDSARIDQVIAFATYPYADRPVAQSRSHSDH